jgi:hypothetical protein
MRMRRITTAALAILISMGASARAQPPEGPSPRRLTELEDTLAKRRALKAWQRARANSVRAVIARWEAIQGVSPIAAILHAKPRTSGFPQVTLPWPVVSVPSNDRLVTQRSGPR